TWGRSDEFLHGNVDFVLVSLESVFKHIENLTEEEKLMKLSTLKLRYFTPREIANLHGFPPEFGMCSQKFSLLFSKERQGRGAVTVC
uniref:Uncharacterized protein n=1 Tax=Pavo cristatus TaxID=9049 RepID=A0A8C9G821_PAVCR